MNNAKISPVNNVKNGVKIKSSESGMRFRKNISIFEPKIPVTKAGNTEP